VLFILPAVPGIAEGWAFQALDIFGQDKEVLEILSVTGLAEKIRKPRCGFFLQAILVYVPEPERFATSRTT